MLWPHATHCVFADHAVARRVRWPVCRGLRLHKGNVAGDLRFHSGVCGLQSPLCRAGFGSQRFQRGTNDVTHSPRIYMGACTCTPSRGMVRALAHGALARKRDSVPYALRALGGHVPAVPVHGFDLVPLLVDIEPVARYTLLRRPAFPGLSKILASRVCSDLIDCLKS